VANSVHVGVCVQLHGTAHWGCSQKHHSLPPCVLCLQAPLFMEDPSNSLSSLLKKATDFAMGGWWLGGTHNVPNPLFADTVGACSRKHPVVQSSVEQLGRASGEPPVTSTEPTCTQSAS
jgi:hypothetical protein